MTESFIKKTDEKEVNGETDKKLLTVCFSGHREILKQHENRLIFMLPKHIESLILKGYRYFGVGGAQGFDYFAFKALKELKIRYENIYIILVLPSRDYFDRYWKPDDYEKYTKMLAGVDKIVYMSDEFTQSCIMRRNEHLVNSSSVIIFYKVHEMTGTGQTVRMAKKRGLKLIDIIYTHCDS